ncbi:MAG: bifunctional [glutamine synthetase] adenylyltransferase/[glutamine synthetase]-adenylyl-L-tyrosine phosphorylase [Mycobacteriales bacterium]|nr:bifunctional [glutamine synthetase] adenylyltransferase/[glutamine synthetase]-adenylyl-L-tyrosine phosphorylase [Frankia sp.]
MSSTGASAAALARLGFVDAARAAASLATPPGNLLLDGAAPDGGVDDGLLASIAATADPDLALQSLLRLVAVAADARALVDALHRNARLRSRLTAVLGASVALGDHLTRHPAEWGRLADDSLDTRRPTPLALRRALLGAVGADPAGAAPVASASDDDALDGLRVAYRGALLELAARDLSAGLAVDDVAGELADIAAATLDAALAVARAAVPDGAGSSRLAIIALGKCGGRELNYVSDVDVVFVAESSDGDDAAGLRTATALANGVIRVCGATTAEGTIWPVDAGLRPEGRSGPLVRTLASHVAYYERWAKTWEFQALLKARAVAGDAELGTAYVERMGPLVWSAASRPAFVDDVRAMKARVEQSVAANADRELKLGPGGLRDVEFAVQLLQLVHGRTDEALRVAPTLLALERLASGGYVGDAEADSLAAAYRFLRSTEHRLQLQRLRRTHVLPDDAATLRWLARAMGYRDGARGSASEQWQADHARHAHAVRRLHEKLFYRPLLSAVARLPADAARLQPEAAVARLSALGFRDPDGALRHIGAMTSGLSRRAAVLRTMLPVMLGWFAEAHDPDAGLLTFRSVAEALGDAPEFLGLLRDSDAVAERLARLLGASRYVADLLSRAPEAVAIVASDAELAPRPAPAVAAELSAVVGRHADPDHAALAARGMRRHELLRTACADLLGQLPVRAVGEALSALTDATVAAALEVAQRAVTDARGAPLDVRLAVIGMGRLGGVEQGYGSDADVLFVHEPVDGASDAAAAATAKEVGETLRRLLAQPAPDPPLVVDADLRPEGRQGPLTRSLASYAQYYARWSAVWEAQALLRARPIAGDADVAESFVEIIAPVRWPAALGSDAVREIRRIKARVETERLPRGIDPAQHLKLGPGGLADVEWTVQLLQLQHAADVAALRTTSTLDALAAARDNDLLATADTEVLTTAWCIATAARNALMLVRGRASDTLPNDASAVTGVARALGYPAGGRAQFLDDYRRATRRARAVVERVFYA